MSLKMHIRERGMEMKKVYQILPVIAHGDGVSQQAFELERKLREIGYQCETYAESIQGKQFKKKVYAYHKLPKTSDEDILLYHLSIGSHLVDDLLKRKGRIVVVYHNITPYGWFAKYDKTLERLCKLGRSDMKKLAARVEFCLADSQFNANELREAGYTCPISVLPIIIDFDKWKSPALKNNADGSTILFTGRIVPNKRVEAVIETFYYLKRYFAPNVKLEIVGTYQEDSLYFQKLQRYIKRLELTDVFFKGHVSEEELAETYENADVYLSLSGHEGFCIPILEAMFFGIPVVALDCGAVSETMNGAGVLVKSTDALLLAGVIYDIIDSAVLREEIIEEQYKRLEEYRQSLKNEEWLNFFR